MSMMTRDDLIAIIAGHRAWLRAEGRGQRADLSLANLRRADLRVADLSGADLRVADLLGADLRGAELRGADLSGADLRVADLSCANLRVAGLDGADLRGADLRGADLRGAILDGALIDDGNGGEFVLGTPPQERTGDDSGASALSDAAEEVYVRAQDPRNVATHAQRAELALDLARLSGMLRQAGRTGDAIGYFEAACRIIA